MTSPLLSVYDRKNLLSCMTQFPVSNLSHQISHANVLYYAIIYLSIYLLTTLYKILHTYILHCQLSYLLIYLFNQANIRFL